MDSQDCGLSNEHFCGGTPDDERAGPDGPCPTCGRAGCVGYCDPNDLIDPDHEIQPYCGPCCICGVSEVCYSDGFDTCTDCLAKR